MATWMGHVYRRIFTANTWRLAAVPQRIAFSVSPIASDLSRRKGGSTQTAEIEAAVVKALRECIEPASGQDLVSIGALEV